MSVAVVEAEATGGGRSTSRCDSSSDDDWTSGALANLAAMFPSLEYDVIVSVLAGHGGSVEAAVEYLMSSFTAAGDTASGFVGMGGGGGGDDDPAGVLEFRTGADIGGRPEVVPGFMYEEEEDEEEEEEEEGSEIGSKAGVSSVGGAAVTPPPVMADEQDPLPTYEQAVWDTEFFRSAQDVVAVSASQQSSSSSSSSFPSPRQLGLVSEEDINSTRETETNCDHQTTKNTAKSKPRRKSKKLKKLASKLSMRRRLDYRAPLEETQQHPLPQSYQPLIEDDEQPWTPPV